MPSPKAKRIYDRLSANKSPMTVTELCAALDRHVVHAALAELASRRLITRDIAPSHGHLLVVYEVDRDHERRQRKAIERETEELAELTKVA